MSQESQIITAFLGGFTAVVLKPVIQRWFQQRAETKSLIEELKDIRRHLLENIKVVQNIKENQFIPLEMHIQKFKIPDTSTVFSVETFRIFHHNYSSRLFDIKLKLRNLNIEFDQILILMTDERNKCTIFEVLNYSDEKMHYVVEALNADINFFNRLLIGEQRISINPKKILQKKYWNETKGLPEDNPLVSKSSEGQRQSDEDTDVKPSEEKDAHVEHRASTGASN